VCQEKRLFFYPGSSIGNFTPEAALAMLRDLRLLCGETGGVLIGVDLVKPAAILEPAYDDALGVTAAFNLNLLARLNREAGADFDLDAFRHEALWNAAASRIEMHLFAKREQVVTIGGRSIHFRTAESIHTENSYKHTPEALAAIARDAGWEPRQVWTDDAGLFGIFLLRHG
jgi:dimethylhistidine N-methyltransferase